MGFRTARLCIVRILGFGFDFDFDFEGLRTGEDKLLLIFGFDRVAPLEGGLLNRTSDFTSDFSLTLSVFFTLARADPVDDGRFGIDGFLVRPVIEGDIVLRFDLLADRCFPPDLLGLEGVVRFGLLIEDRCGLGERLARDAWSDARDLIRCCIGEARLIDCFAGVLDRGALVGVDRVGVAWVGVAGPRLLVPLLVTYFFFTFSRISSSRPL